MTEPTDPLEGLLGDDEVPFESREALIPGFCFGRYKLLAPISSGGMGQVWLAESQDRARQRVAIKFIKSKNINANLRDRFEREKESLGRMNHESVAKIFDSGVLPEYGPYIVMEHVAGYEIDLYAKSHNLSLKEILRLFVEVCDAIMHAHSKMVLHRDIKPGNILVKNDDGSGHLTKGSNRRFQVKVIDFGIARIVDTLPFEGEAQTVEGDVIGTNGYMSPESALGEKDRIDTRSDVYSLGVLLYELLHGHLPYSPVELKKVSTKTELIRVYEGEAGIWKAEKSDKLDLKDVPKDLKLICEKSMRFEPDARYGSPAELAQDCLNYLEGNEVEARPPSLSYKFTRFASRNKKSISVASLFLILIVGSLSLLLSQNSVLVKTADNLRSSQREVLLRYREGTMSSIELKANSRDEDARTQLATMDFDVRSELDLSESVSQSLTEVRDVAYGMLYGLTAEVGLEDGLPKNLGFESFTANESNTDALFFSRAVTDSNQSLTPRLYHMALRDEFPEIQTVRSSFEQPEEMLATFNTNNSIPSNHPNFFYDLCFSSKSSSFLALWGGLLFEIVIDGNKVVDVRVDQLALNPDSRIPTSLFVDELGDAFVTFKIPDAGLLQIQRIISNTTGLSLGSLQHVCTGLGPDVRVVHQFENGDQVLVDMGKARTEFQLLLNSTPKDYFGDSRIDWEKVALEMEELGRRNLFEAMTRSAYGFTDADFKCPILFFNASEDSITELALFQPGFFSPNDCEVRFVDGILYWIDASDTSLNYIDQVNFSHFDRNRSQSEMSGLTSLQPEKVALNKWSDPHLRSVSGELLIAAQDGDHFGLFKGSPANMHSIRIPGASMEQPRLSGPSSCEVLGDKIIFLQHRNGGLRSIGLFNDSLAADPATDSFFTCSEKLNRSLMDQYHDHLVYLAGIPSLIFEDFFSHLLISGANRDAFFYNELTAGGHYQFCYPPLENQYLDRISSTEWYDCITNTDIHLHFPSYAAVLVFEDVQSPPYFISGQGGDLEVNRVFVLHDQVVVVPPETSPPKVLSHYELPEQLPHPSCAVHLPNGQTLIAGGTCIAKYGSNNLLISKLEIPGELLPQLFSDSLTDLAFDYDPERSFAGVFNLSQTSHLFGIGPSTYLYQLENALFLIDISTMEIIDSLHVPLAHVALGSSLTCQRLSQSVFVMQDSHLDGVSTAIIECLSKGFIDGSPSLEYHLTLPSDIMPSGIFYSSDTTGPSVGDLWISSPVTDSGIKLRTSIGVPGSSTPQPRERESDPLPDPKE